MYHRRRPWGRAPTRRRCEVFVIFRKKSYFNAIGSHFARVQSHLKELDEESKLKKIELFNPPFTCNLRPNHD